MYETDKLVFGLTLSNFGSSLTINTNPYNDNMKLIQGRNELVPFTRRYPNLKHKQLIRDSKVAKRLIEAWDFKRSDKLVFEVFSKEHTQLSDPRYWELLKSTWITAGSNERSEQFRKWMSAKRGYKAWFMSPEEQDVYKLLPDVIVCYRACNEPDNGISYTLSGEYAERYKEMFDKETIKMRYVSKDLVFAYINRNNEEELIVL